jgi:DNA-directed RNA polymerase subunit M/transcription elongation factor TFIIS
MNKETYLFKAFVVLNTKDKPKSFKTLFDDLTKQDSTKKPNRFFKKPIKQKITKYNTDTEYTNRTFFCPKCKKNETKVVTKQTRSADEGETIFFLCKYCKKSYKI